MENTTRSASYVTLAVQVMKTLRTIGLIRHNYKSSQEPDLYLTAAHVYWYLTTGSTVWLSFSNGTRDKVFQQWSADIKDEKASPVAKAMLSGFVQQLAEVVVNENDGKVRHERPAWQKMGKAGLLKTELFEILLDKASAERGRKECGLSPEAQQLVQDTLMDSDVHFEDVAEIMALFSEIIKAAVLT